MMTQNLILVTGASRGIGAEIAKVLDQQGYQLLLHARKKENLTDLLAQLTRPEAHEILCAEFSNPEAIKTFCSAFRKLAKGRLLAVVNNAGLAIDKPLMYQPESEIDVMFSVNLKAPIMISKTALKLFATLGQGTILNISSVIGTAGNACQSIYAATKSGLNAFSLSLAKETGAIGSNANIRVLSIAPGFIQTDMSNAIDESIKENYLDQIPSNRMGNPAEVAALVSFLLSDQAKYINGSCIHINGGML